MSYAISCIRPWSYCVLNLILRFIAGNLKRSLRRSSFLKEDIGVRDLFGRENTLKIKIS